MDGGGLERQLIVPHFGQKIISAASQNGQGLQPSSRNRRVGERIGAGDSVVQALASVDGVCEGIPTTEALHPILLKNSIDAPIAKELFQVVKGSKSPKAALMALLDRGTKLETE